MRLEDLPEHTAKGRFGWGGAAGTYTFVDPVDGTRALVMANDTPSSHWPFRVDLVDAVYTGTEC